MPITAACQRQPASRETGIRELNELVMASEGAPAPAQLAQFESRFPKTRAAELSRFLRGYLAYNSKNYPAAIEALGAKSIAAETALGDYALFFKAESESGAGMYADALRDYRAVANNEVNSLKKRDAAIRAAQTQLSTGNPAGAVAEAGPRAEANDADALLVTAQAAEAQRDRDRALQLYRRIYYELPATTASPQAEARLNALGASPQTSKAGYSDELARCERLYDADQFYDAAAAYESLLRAFPDQKLSDESALHYGISQLKSKKPAQAVIQLTAVTGAKPAVHAEALFNLADALRKSNRDAQAAASVDQLVAAYPKTRWAEEALHDLAASLDKDGRDSEAAARYRQLLKLYPNSNHAAEATYQLGWRAYQSKQYAEAVRMLEQHLRSYRVPQTKFLGEAGFWAAKSAEKLGNRARALTLYELVARRYRYGYHGYLAGLRAGRLRNTDTSLKAEPVKPGSDLERIESNILFVQSIEETADGSEQPRVARADDLEVIGLGDIAVRELNAALEAAPSSPRINLRLAQLYARRGENFQASLILRRGYPDIYSYRDEDLPREAWEVFFPLNNWDTIKQEAKRYGIDPFNAAGLIRQESVFNPKAVSRVGARGLMQVMPATGQVISRRQGNGSITASDLFNPTLNIKLGMSYLAQMLGQFGRLEYAAAAYNAGPNRAQRWIAERGSLDIEDWIEAIPFSETRGYVQGVLRYAANYRRFYRE